MSPKQVAWSEIEGILNGGKGYELSVIRDYLLIPNFEMMMDVFIIEL